MRLQDVRIPPDYTSSAIGHSLPLLSCIRFVGVLDSGARRAAREPGNGLLCGPDHVSDKSKVDQRSEISVALGRLGRSNCVPPNGNFEADLQEVPEVRLDTQVRSHFRQDDLVDTLLAKLKHQIVGPGAIQSMRRANDCLSVINVLLELRHEFGAETPKTLRASVGHDDRTCAARAAKSRAGRRTSTCNPTDSSSAVRLRR